MARKLPKNTTTMKILVLFATVGLAYGQRDPCELTTCSGINQFCSNGACVNSSAPGMLDAIADFATGNPGATFATSTSSSFDALFSCVANNTADSNLLKAQQHHVWQGAVDYYKQNINRIIVQESEQSSVLVEVVDAWGARCKHASQPDEPQSCSLPSQSWWFECPEGCLPQGLLYPDPELAGAFLEIDIYEPCNFVSNLAYYRVMNQVCGPHFNYDEAVSSAFAHAFGALAPGSALWHGSHTYMGKVADVEMVDVVVYMAYQQVIGSVGDTLGLSGSTNDGNLVQASKSTNKISVADYQKLFTLPQNRPRPMTAIEIANYVTDFITTKHVDEWAYEFDTTLEQPGHVTTITMIITSAVAFVFEDKPQFVNDTLSQLGAVLPGDSNYLMELLPDILALGQSLSLTDDQKFILFRHLLGMGGKMLYALLWQEKTIDFDYGNAQANAQAPIAMPTAIAFFNLLSGFTHIDEAFQRFEGMYPGDAACRATQPHAKWHEVSASGLLDMIYMADCVGAMAKGKDECAHMSTLVGKERITKADFREFVKSEILLLNIPEFPADAIVLDLASNLLADQIFELWDEIDPTDGQIDWTDVDGITDLVGWVNNFFTRAMTLYENFCTTDANCGAGRYCDLVGLFGTPLQCTASSISNGLACTVSGACQSGTCAIGVSGPVCGTGCGGHNMCNGNEWCSTSFAPRMCQPKLPGGSFPCLANAQCDSGACAWYGECRHSGGACDRDEFLELGVCIPKLPQGSVCLGNHMCRSNSCSGMFVKRCSNDDFAFCSDVGCSQATLDASIQSICAAQGCSPEELNNRLNQGLGWITNVGLPFP